MALTYAIVDSFSIVFLLILFISTREKFAKLTETRCFRSIVIMTIIALLGDMIAWQCNGKAGETIRIILWISNILCYIISGIMTLTWLYYTGLKMNRLSRIKKLVWLLLIIPCALLITVSVLTPWTHWMFYLSKDNAYQRGALFVLQMIIPFGYILAAAVWSCIRACKERLRQQKNEYLYLAAFIIFPLLGGILQLVIYGLSIVWPCTALSLMLVYVSMQNQKISLDALTGLNNRGQLDKHLYSCIERAENEVHFALFMLDIDDFKKINDQYGHIAGDAALIDAAAIIKKALAQSNSFIARYGGDEFAIVLYYTDEKQIKELIKRIDDESYKCSENVSTPYKLVFSIGYACYDKQRYSNYQDMITAADAHMYKQKRLHKVER